MFDTTQKRLFILYTLYKAHRKLSASEISGVLISLIPINWFDLQTEIMSLKKDDLIYGDEKLALTLKGEEVIKVYEKDLPALIKDDIDDYIREHKEELSGENQIISNFRESELGYSVNLILTDNRLPLIDLKLTVPNRELAEKTCKKWKERAVEYYQLIIEVLT